MTSSPRSPSRLVGCHGLLYNLALIVPSVIFVAYLAFLARRSFAKLTNGYSYVMIAYYALIWLISVLNLLWCLVQAWQCAPEKELSWNMLSLFTESGMLFLEVSLLAFLLQGNHAGGLDVLTRTFVISGVIVAADTLLKAIYIFGFGVPLFSDNNETAHHARWGLWIVRKLLLTAVYGSIFFMHQSKWRERLPGDRSSFWKTSILQLRLCYAIIKYNVPVWLSACGKWSWIWDLVVQSYNRMLPLSLSSASLRDLPGRFFPGRRFGLRERVLL
ncbi:hypothetical protein OPV22_017352 [Ensete ventricosum]|uniref:Transmembrane protein 138 n=1 Tax=Ensete ventricosum TaxID=4639 RepID=A0AAV8QXT3_ENSVE|nr:hypothetical protein OPV22_017352 [Ensete ventricosum]